ncbi:MAG: 30S ribosome-binding factor RbfA [Pedosphaera parvula]|nr:30S ribosome-binding factor RbfA [Pedosphaera parvula]
MRELLKRALGEIVRRELPVAEAGLITVNDVGVSADLHSATVFVGLVGSADQKKRANELLQSERKRLQHLLAQAVILKYTPQLRFVVDDSIERGNRVIQIIEELEHTLPPDEAASEDH